MDPIAIYSRGIFASWRDLSAVMDPIAIYSPALPALFYLAGNNSFTKIASPKEATILPIKYDNTRIKPLFLSFSVSF